MAKTMPACQCLSALTKNICPKNVHMYMNSSIIAFENDKFTNIFSQLRKSTMKAIIVMKKYKNNIINKGFISLVKNLWNMFDIEKDICPNKAINIPIIIFIVH